MRHIMVIILGLLASGCSLFDPSNDSIEICERNVISKLKSPSSYVRKSANSFIDVEKKHIFVNIEYDASNSYGVPIRDTELCQFETEKGSWPSRSSLSMQDPEFVENDSPTVEGSATEPAPQPLTVSKPEPKPKKVPGKDQAIADSVTALDDSPTQSECWEDYCPCEGEQGGPDAYICRNLRAGIPVSDEQMSLGAGMRDARKQISDFKASNPDF